MWQKTLWCLKFGIFNEKNYMKPEFPKQQIFLMEKIVFELTFLNKECVHLWQQRSESSPRRAGFYEPMGILVKLENKPSRTHFLLPDAENYHCILIFLRTRWIYCHQPETCSNKYIHLCCLKVNCILGCALRESPGYHSLSAENLFRNMFC